MCHTQKFTTAQRQGNLLSSKVLVFLLQMGFLSWIKEGKVKYKTTKYLHYITFFHSLLYTSVKLPLKHSSLRVFKFMFSSLKVTLNSCILKEEKKNMVRTSLISESRTVNHCQSSLYFYWHNVNSLMLFLI